MSDKKDSDDIEKEPDKRQDKRGKIICRVCGGVGHMSYNCANIKCYNCGGFGHKSFECPKKRQQYGYGRRDRYDRYDRYEGGYQNVKCFNCGKYGHKSFECNKPDGKYCYRCGQPDHISVNCPLNKDKDK